MLGVGWNTKNTVPSQSTQNATISNPSGAHVTGMSLKTILEKNNLDKVSKTSLTENQMCLKRNESPRSTGQKRAWGQKAERRRNSWGFVHSWFVYFIRKAETVPLALFILLILRGNVTVFCFYGQPVYLRNFYKNDLL